MNTSFTPATAVLKVRVFGNSPSGPVATLRRGSLLATYSYFPRGFTSKTHSPILAAVPDGWSFGNIDTLVAFDERLQSVDNTVTDGPLTGGTVVVPKFGLEEFSIRMQKSFVPLVLAEEVVIRRSHPAAAYTDVHVSALVRGVSDIHGRWVDSEGTTADIPQKMFQAGEEFSVMLSVDPVTGRQDMLLTASVRTSTLRQCKKTYKQLLKPVGEFVHAPVKLSTTVAETITGVFIDTLTSKQLRAGAGFGDKVNRFVVNLSKIYRANGFPYDRTYNFNDAEASNVYRLLQAEFEKIYDFYGLDKSGSSLFDTTTIPTTTAMKTTIKDALSMFNILIASVYTDLTSIELTNFLGVRTEKASFVQSAIEDGHGLVLVERA